MPNSLSPLSPPVALAAGVAAFALWVAFDATSPVPGTAFVVVVPEPEVRPIPSMSVRVAEGEPPLQPGMSREVVERLVGAVASEGAETTDVVRGVRRVDYRVCLVGGHETPGGWSRVTVEFDDSSSTQVVSFVTLMPLPEPEMPEMPDPHFGPALPE